MNAKSNEVKKGIGSMLIDRLTSLNEALDDPKVFKAKFTQRKVVLDLEPREYEAETVQQVRESIHASQAVFAQILGVTVDSVQSWEMGRRKPSKMACRFMDEIQLAPDHWLERLNESAHVPC